MSAYNGWRSTTGRLAGEGEMMPRVQLTDQTTSPDLPGLRRTDTPKTATNLDKSRQIWTNLDTESRNSQPRAADPRILTLNFSAQPRFRQRLAVRASHHSSIAADLEASVFPVQRPGAGAGQGDEVCLQVGEGAAELSQATSVEQDGTGAAGVQQRGDVVRHRIADLVVARALTADQLVEVPDRESARRGPAPTRWS